jgi:hypothetical protein
MSLNNKKVKISRFFQPKLNYFEYTNENPIYTIISPNNTKCLKLFKDLRINKVNHVHINSKLFTDCDMESIYDHYLIDKVSPPFENPLIFLDEKYIGGINEMYKIIPKY